jgi:hemerythrin-like domain-containing protein
MKPIGPLMWEHRIIERMVPVLGEELNRMKKTGKADPRFIVSAVDFFRTYADRTHLGKEEDILFKVLESKMLEEMKAGKRDSAEFWIDLNDRKIHIRYFASGKTGSTWAA